MNVIPPRPNDRSLENRDSTNVAPEQDDQSLGLGRRFVFDIGRVVHGGDERGDTLIEVLLSIVILGLASLALIVAFGTSITASGEHRSLTTADTYVKTVGNYVASSVQSSTSDFSTCPPDASSVLAMYTGLASQLTVPGYSASVTSVEYWNTPTAGIPGSWGSQCVTGAPQLITVTLTNSATNAVNTLSLVVDSPQAPAVTPAGPVTQLGFTLQPSGAAVGAPFIGQPQLAYEDVNHIVNGNYLPPNPIVLSVASGPGSLINCTNPSGSYGYINFTGCELDTVGTYTLTASDGTYSVTSKPFTVSKGTNSISITSTAPTNVIANSTTYTPVATATSGDTVLITSATPNVCTISAGVVSFNGPGVCALNFNDPGNASYNAAPTLAQGVNVYLANAVTVTSTAPASAVVNGTTYTPSATAASGDAILISSQSTSVCVVAAAKVSFVGAGTCSLEFSDPGNATYVSAVSYQSFVVGPGANSITVNSSPPQPPTYGSNYSPSATALSGDGVVVTSATSTTCSVASSVVTFIHVGTCTIDFNDSGNTNYVAAVQVTQTMVVTAAPLSVGVSGTQSYGGSAIYTPTFSGFVNGDSASVVTGTLNCQTNATAASHPAGGFSISACSGLTATNYTMNYHYASLTVTKATPIITWSNPPAITYGTTLSATQLKATTTIAGSFAYSPSVGTILSPGSQSLGTTFTPTDSIDYTTAAATATLVVNKAPQSLSFSAGTSSLPWSSTTTLTSSGESGTGAVSYFVDSGGNGHTSANNLCTVNSSTGVLSATGAGNCYVYGVVATDADYLAATSADQLVVFTKVSQSLSVSTTPATAGWTTALNLEYVAPGTGAVTYQLEGPSGSTLGDATAGGNPAVANGAVRLGVAGPTLFGGNAISLSGASGTYVSTTKSYNNPGSSSMSIWFKTTSVGDLMGFSTSQTDATSVNWDRMMWIDNSGNLVAGVYNNATDEAISPTTYNDGNWHFAVLTYGPAGEVLYVDGVQVTSNSLGTSAQNYVGYWHLGYDNNASWANAPSDSYFAGSLSHAAVYPSQLTNTQVSALYGATSLALEDSTVMGLSPTSYWPLDNTVCSINVSSSQLVATAPGTCYFSGSIAADANYLAATSPVTSTLFTVASQTITATTSQSSTPWNNPVTVSATGESGTGALAYALDTGANGSSSSSACSLNSSTGVLSATAPSTCYVYVSIAGDTNYQSAQSADQTVTFTLANQNITALVSPTSLSHSSNGNPYATVSASGQSGAGSLTYSLDNGSNGHTSSSRCVLSGLHLYATRSSVTCYVYVTIAADSHYSGATSTDVSASFT